MSPYPADLVFPSRITRAFRVSFLGSVVVHLLAAVIWTSTPPSGMPGGAVLQVTLVSGDVATSGSTPGQTASPVQPAVAALEVVSAWVGEAKPMTAPEPPVSVEPVQHREILAVTDGDTPPVDAAPVDRRNSEGEAQARQRVEPSPARAAKPQTPSANPPRRVEQVEDRQERVPEQVAVAGVVPEGVKDRQLRSPGASPAVGEGGGTGGETYQSLQAALRKALLPRLDYPLLARRRGWEGRVRIGVVVEPDGDLKDVHVVESSGFKVLDRAAVKDLKEVGTLTTVNDWLGDEGMDVTLPVQYRLR